MNDSYVRLTDRQIAKAVGDKELTDDQIRNDIAATKDEIDKLTHSRAVYLSVAPRLAIGRAAQIRERKEFVRDLEKILELRGVKV